MSSHKQNLKHSVYNIRSFAPTAEEFRQKVLKFFPNAKIGYKISEKRQKMVDGWPMDTDDSAAKEEWNWKPMYDLDNGLSEYLIPELKEMYQ